MTTTISLQFSNDSSFCDELRFVTLGMARAAIRSRSISAPLYGVSSYVVSWSTNRMRCSRCFGRVLERWVTSSPIPFRCPIVWRGIRLSSSIFLWSAGNVSAPQWKFRIEFLCSGQFCAPSRLCAPTDSRLRWGLSSTRVECESKFLSRRTGLQ